MTGWRIRYHTNVFLLSSSSTMWLLESQHAKRWFVLLVVVFGFVLFKLKIFIGFLVVCFWGSSIVCNLLFVYPALQIFDALQVLLGTRTVQACLYSTWIQWLLGCFYNSQVPTSHVTQVPLWRYLGGCSFLTPLLSPPAFLSCVRYRLSSFLNLSGD